MYACLISTHIMLKCVNNQTMFVLSHFCSGRFIMGYSTSRAYKSTGGEEKVTLKLTQIPPHQHEIGGIINSDMYGDKYNYNVATDRLGLFSKPSGGNAAGTTDSHENMPPYVAVIYIMKTN